MDDELVIRVGTSAAAREVTVNVVKGDRNAVFAFSAEKAEEMAEQLIAAAGMVRHGGMPGDPPPTTN